MSVLVSSGFTNHRQPESVPSLPQPHYTRRQDRSSTRPTTSAGHETSRGGPNPFQNSFSTAFFSNSRSVLDLARTSSPSSSVTLVDPPALASKVAVTTQRPRKLTRRRSQSNAEEPWLLVIERDPLEMRDSRRRGKVSDKCLNPAQRLASRGDLPETESKPASEFTIVPPADAQAVRDPHSDIRRILSQPSLVHRERTRRPSTSSALPRQHTPRAVAPPSSFKSPTVSDKDSTTHPPAARPQPSADVQRILAKPTLLSPVKHTLPRSQSVGDLTDTSSLKPTPTPSLLSTDETLVESPRRPRKLVRPRSRCSSTTSLASTNPTKVEEKQDQQWFVLNVVRPGEGWDEDKIKVETPAREVPPKPFTPRRRAQSSISPSSSISTCVGTDEVPLPPAVKPIVPLEVKEDPIAVEGKPSTLKGMSRCRSWFNLKLPSRSSKTSTAAPPSRFLPFGNWRSTNR